MDQKTKKALLWIVSLLKEKNIPFRLSGGFAAQLYGSSRPLNDIDIEVPDAALDPLEPLVKKYIIWGPERWKDEVFDLLLMTLNYEGQEIDLSGVDTEKVYNKIKNQWENFSIPMNQFTLHRVEGLEIPVIKKEHLLAYKSKIQREVDLQDIQAIDSIKTQ